MITISTRRSLHLRLQVFYNIVWCVCVCVCNAGRNVCVCVCVQFTSPSRNELKTKSMTHDSAIDSIFSFILFVANVARSACLETFEQMRSFSARYSSRIRYPRVMTAVWVYSCDLLATAILIAILFAARFNNSNKRDRSLSFSRRYQRSDEADRLKRVITDFLRAFYFRMFFFLPAFLLFLSLSPLSFSLLSDNVHNTIYGVPGLHARFLFFQTRDKIRDIRSVSATLVPCYFFFFSPYFNSL